MRQYNLFIQFLGLHQTRLVRVRSQINKMGDHLRYPRAVQTTLGQDAANNRVLVSLGDIAAGHHNIFEKQTRIRAMLAGVGQFPFRQ